MRTTDDDDRPGGDDTGAQPGATVGSDAAGDGVAGLQGTADQPPRGADMARAALEAARARNAAGRAGGRRGGFGSRSGTDGDVRRLRRRRWSGPGDDKARDPQPLGDTLKTWLVKNDTGGELIKARLFAQWPAIVGREIAEHAQPVALQDGELLVQADSTAWATQLRLLAPGMVKRINQALGHGTVLRIRTKGPTAPSWRFGNRHVPGRGPRDTYG